MTSTSTQLLQLIGECERSANEILRKDHCNLLVRHVLNKMGPRFKIEFNAMDAIQVKLKFQINISTALVLISTFQEATEAYITRIFKNLEAKHKCTTGSIIKAQDIKEALKNNNDVM